MSLNGGSANININQGMKMLGEVCFFVKVSDVKDFRLTCLVKYIRWFTHLPAWSRSWWWRYYLICQCNNDDYEKQWWSEIWWSGYFSTSQAIPSGQRFSRQSESEAEHENSSNSTFQLTFMLMLMVIMRLLLMLMEMQGWAGIRARWFFIFLKNHECTLKFFRVLSKLRDLATSGSYLNPPDTHIGCEKSLYHL